MTDLDYQRFDSEQPAIRRAGGGATRKLGVIALFGAGALGVGLLFWRDYAQRQPDLLAKDRNEAFSVPASPMPNFQEANPKIADRSDMLKVTPPPAPAAPAAATSSDPNGDLAARLRLAEEQRRLEAERADRARREAQEREAKAKREAAERAEKERLAKLEAFRQERIKSPLLIMDKEDQAARDAAAASGAAVPVRQDTESDPNRAFLVQASNRDVEVARASRLPRTDALVAQGTLIHGTLDVAIQSDLPGMIRATTTDDVWSFDGRRVLIPRGSRLIGEYKSGLQRGQTRIFVVWTRMIDADGKASVQLGSIGTDDLGRAGLTGDLDRHYVERFGSAILLSVIGGGAQFIAGLGQQTQTSTSMQVYDPATGRYTTIQTQPNQQLQNGRQIGAQHVSQTLTTLAQDALKDSIAVPPTVYVDQGARIEIFVRRDLDFSALYPDPVRAEIARLRKGGSLRVDVDPTPLPSAASPTVVVPASPLAVRKP